MNMETPMTIPVMEELNRMQAYLNTLPEALRVDIAEPIPTTRYLIPQSLMMIVQQIHRQHPGTHNINIHFLKYNVEISHPIKPHRSNDESFTDLSELSALYRQYFSLPSIRQTIDTEVISIPLFI